MENSIISAIEATKLIGKDDSKAGRRFRVGSPFKVYGYGSGYFLTSIEIDQSEGTVLYEAPCHAELLDGGTDGLFAYVSEFKKQYISDPAALSDALIDLIGTSEAPKWECKCDEKTTSKNHRFCERYGIMENDRFVCYVAVRNANGAFLAEERKTEDPETVVPSEFVKTSDRALAALSLLANSGCLGSPDLSESKEYELHAVLAKENPSLFGFWEPAVLD